MEVFVIGHMEGESGQLDTPGLKNNLASFIPYAALRGIRFANSAPFLFCS